MPIKPWVRNISPLAWFLCLSAVSNVLTAGAVLYLAFGTQHVYVRGGYLRASTESPESVAINDRTPIRVRIVP